MAKTIRLTEARSKLSGLLDDLERGHEHLVITRNGRPAGILIAVAELEAIEESLEILQDDDLLEALRESEEDIQAGRVHALLDVRQELGIG